MQKFSQPKGVSLAVSVFLADDTYDYIPNTYSATGLIKPLKQTILAKRVPPNLDIPTVTNVFKARMGNALHDGVENAWKLRYKKNLQSLGYPQDIIDRIVINPTKVSKRDIPVYMEQRMKRVIDGHTVTGKYDFIGDGVLEDFKSTSTYVWGKESKDIEYQLQGSIYRWLDANNIITSDYIQISFMFTDWSAGKAFKNENYPQEPTPIKHVPLLSLTDTEEFITSKIVLLTKYNDTPEEGLPPCNDRDLWRNDPEYKYYSNPEKLTRATKNFKSDAAGAYAHLNLKGVGIVKEIVGKPTACIYCKAFPICKQKDTYIMDGTLNPEERR